MTTDYVLRVKGRADQKLTKEEALECFKILDTRDSTVTLTVAGRILWYFTKKDIRIEKPETSQDNPEYTQERSQNFHLLRAKREKWTNEMIATMSQEELDKFKQLAIARFWNWYERSRASLRPEWFDSYIKGYIRVLIRWKKWYRDDQNDYRWEHFSDWAFMVERPDLLPA